jgi:hypothetical protein
MIVIEDYVRFWFDYSQIEKIAQSVENDERPSSLILLQNLEGIYYMFKDEITKEITDYFYKDFVGDPQSWLNCAKKFNLDIINIEDAKKFYAACMIELTCQKIVNNQKAIEAELAKSEYDDLLVVGGIHD